MLKCINSSLGEMNICRCMQAAATEAVSVQVVQKRLMAHLNVFNNLLTAFAYRGLKTSHGARLRKFLSHLPE